MAVQMFRYNGKLMLTYYKALKLITAIPAYPLTMSMKMLKPDL